MTIFLYFLAIIACSIGISKSGSLVISAITKIANTFRISDFTLGFFVLGIATTTPELFVGINSALRNIPQLSLGNIIGGIIVLLSLVVSLTAIFSGKISFRDAFSAKELLLASFLIISPTFLIVDGYLSRFDGLLLVIFYGVFFFIMNRKETLLEHIRDELISEPMNSAKLLFKLTLGIAGLLVFSKIIVEVAILLVEILNIALLLLGLLVLSIGTNLPEITVAFFSRKTHKSLAIGNFFGSACANILVLGVVALINPFSVISITKLYISLGILILTVSLFSIFARSGRTISRNEGFLLFLVYILFLVSEIISNSWHIHS